MAIPNLVQTRFVGYVPNGRFASKQMAGSPNEEFARVSRPWSSACVPGILGVAASYSSPYFSFAGGDGYLGPITRPIPYTSLDPTATATLTYTVENLGATGTPIGSGIDATAGDVTRYYSLGWVGDRIDIGTDPLIQFTGEPMEGGWDEDRETKVIGGGVVRQVKIVLPAANPPDVPGVKKWWQAAWVFLTNPADPLARRANFGFYLGQAPQSGGTIYDWYSTLNLAQRGEIFPANLQNFPALRFISTYGQAFAGAQGQQSFDSDQLFAADATFAKVENIAGDKKRLWLRRSQGDTWAYDPLDVDLTGVMLEWPEFVVGCQIMLEGFGNSRVKPTIVRRERSTSTDDFSLYTVIVLSEELPVELTEPVSFRVQGRNVLFFGHPDPRLACKAPAGREVDLKAIGMRNVATAGIQLYDTDQYLVASVSEHFRIQVPKETSVIGVAGGSAGTIPVTAPIPSDIGTCSPHSLFYGKDHRVMGFCPNRGPWILQEDAPQLLDPARLLSGFYAGLSEANLGNCQGAYTNIDGLAVWCFPGDEQQVGDDGFSAGNEIALCYDFNADRLGFWQIRGQKLQAIAEVEQYTNSDAYTVLGSRLVFSIGCFTGNNTHNAGFIGEFTRKIFTDLQIEPATKIVQGEVLSVAANSVTLDTDDISIEYLTGYACIVGTADDMPWEEDFKDRMFSERMIDSAEIVVVSLANKVRLNFSASTVWGNGAPEVGDIITIAPIYLMWESGDIRVRASRCIQVRGMRDLAMDYPRGTSQTSIWGVRFIVLSSGLTNEPVETADGDGASGESITNWSSVEIKAGKELVCGNSDAGRAVRARFELMTTQDGAFDIDPMELDVEAN